MILFGFPMVLDWMHWEGTEQERTKQRKSHHIHSPSPWYPSIRLTRLLQTAELLDGIVAILGTPRQDADHLKEGTHTHTHTVNTSGAEGNTSALTIWTFGLIFCLRARRYVSVRSSGSSHLGREHAQGVVEPSRDVAPPLLTNTAAYICGWPKRMPMGPPTLSRVLTKSLAAWLSFLVKSTTNVCAQKSKTKLAKKALDTEKHTTTVAHPSLPPH